MGCIVAIYLARLFIDAVDLGVAICGLTLPYAPVVVCCIARPELLCHQTCLWKEHILFSLFFRKVADGDGATRPLIQLTAQSLQALWIWVSQRRDEIISISHATCVVSQRLNENSLDLQTLNSHLDLSDHVEMY